jgi:hypothetical protein
VPNLPQTVCQEVVTQSTSLSPHGQDLQVSCLLGGVHLSRTVSKITRGGFAMRVPDFKFDLFFLRLRRHLKLVHQFVPNDETRRIIKTEEIDVSELVVEEIDYDLLDEQYDADEND